MCGTYFLRYIVGVLLSAFRFFPLSGKKQKDGKRSFAESCIGIAAVAEVSEQAVKYRRAVAFVGICS